MKKQELRNIIKEEMKLVSKDQRDTEAHIVFETVKTLSSFDSAKHILLYRSLPDELPTDNVIAEWAKTKMIYLPRISGDELEVVPYSEYESINKRFKVREPEGNAITDLSIIDLVIVPAIALDCHCNRLGRGKGYYDRLLPLLTKAETIGVAMDCQYVKESLPTEPNDVQLDAVITRSNINFRDRT